MGPMNEEYRQAMALEDIAFLKAIQIKMTMQQLISEEEKAKIDEIISNYIKSR